MNVYVVSSASHVGVVVVVVVIWVMWLWPLLLLLLLSSGLYVACGCGRCCGRVGVSVVEWVVNQSVVSLCPVVVVVVIWVIWLLLWWLLWWSLLSS